MKSNILSKCSKAIRTAIIDKLDRIKNRGLAKESAKLDSDAEKSMAEEGFSVELEEWPGY